MHQPSSNNFNSKKRVVTSKVSATATVFTLLQLAGTTAERNASSASAEQSVSYAECSHAQFGLESAGNWAGACEMERAAK